MDTFPDTVPVTGTPTWARHHFGEADHPTAEYIEQLRGAFPVEPEIDAVLTRKMRRRPEPPFARPALSDLADCVRSYLRTEIEGECTVSGLCYFTGGVSKVQLGFTLDWTTPDGEPRTERLVVRMDPKEGSNATSRRREFELIRALDGTVPVPRPFGLDPDGEFFPEPALIYSYAAGVTKPRTAATGKISGLGTDFGPLWRGRLAPQFMEHLARIHTFDIAAADFQSLAVPRPGTTDCAAWLVNQARRTWEEDRGEDFALMEVAANWLERNLPVLDTPSIVHGDYRSGNFLFDEESGRITAWLDWERGHIGDRHRDLAWTMNETFGHYDENGRYLVCGLIPREEFLPRYEDASGLKIDDQRLTFYRILNSFQLIVSTMASAYRVVHLGKSHQDILLARVRGMTPVVAADLRRLLKENL